MADLIGVEKSALDYGVDCLGMSVRDVITGLQGTATAYVHYISGCDQVLISLPLAADGKMPDAQWIDVQRLMVKPDNKIVLNNTKTPGFDKEPPKR